MSTETFDMSTKEWAALKEASKKQHGTVYNGDNSGTATTDTPGVGKTVVAYEYDPSAQTCKFTIKEKPYAVPPEVIWFALGGQIAQAAGAPEKSY